MDRMQAVLEASPNAVLVVDEAGRIQRANRTVPNVLGYEPGEIEGMVIEELLREDDRTHHLEYREEYVQAPHPRPMGRELDLYALHQSGEEIPVEISLGPIRQDSELHVVATIADISKRKERERELQRQNERLDEFTSVVSHDLRNPLRVAFGRLKLAREECDSVHHDPIEGALERMETLIEDLLAIAREGETSVDIAPVSLADAVKVSWQSVETVGATLTVETEQTVMADASRLKQLLENLFRNAVEHGGPRVEVTVGDLHNQVGFLVVDDGPGIPEAKREDALQAGYSSSDEGTGFGLSIVSRIAGSHGWELTITEGQEGGARFEFTGVDSAS